MIRAKWLPGRNSASRTFVPDKKTRLDERTKVVSRVFEPPHLKNATWTL